MAHILSTTNRWPMVAFAALLLVGVVTYFRSSTGSDSEDDGIIEHVNAANFEEKVLHAGVPVLDRVDWAWLRARDPVRANKVSNRVAFMGWFWV